MRRWFVCSIVAFSIALSSASAQPLTVVTPEEWQIDAIRSPVDFEGNPFAFPEWRDNKPLLRSHFARLTAPLDRFEIRARPLQELPESQFITLVFQADLYREGRFDHSLRFITHLERVGDSYKNDFLVFPKAYEVKLSIIKDSAVIGFASQPLDSQAAQEFAFETERSPEVRLYFTRDRGLYRLLEEYSRCAATGGKSVSISYSYSISSLAREYIASCRGKEPLVVVDQSDWLYYKALVYNLDAQAVPYYIVLKNRIEIRTKGRNPTHLKLFSPDESGFLLTSAAITLQSLNSDDWFLEVQGESAVRALKGLYFQDLFFGNAPSVEIAAGVEAFSTETPLYSSFDSSSNRSKRLRSNSLDDQLLSDLQSARKSIVIYAPAVPSIGKRNYDYSLLLKVLKEKIEEGVRVSIFESTDVFNGNAEFRKLAAHKNFSIITPSFSHLLGRSPRPIHARWINVDRQVCYLLTGHLGNGYTNDIAFRLTDKSYCEQIAHHLEDLYGGSWSRNLVVRILGGFLKLFRVTSRQDAPQVFEFLVNGEEQATLDFTQSELGLSPPPTSR